MKQVMAVAVFALLAMVTLSGAAPGSTLGSLRSELLQHYFAPWR
jgi:hypothetical protein